MKVSDLAREFHTSSDSILDVLKSLKLKAKDKDQELNSFVLSVLRSEFAKGRVKIVKDIKEEKPKAVEAEKEKAQDVNGDLGKKEKAAKATKDSKDKKEIKPKVIKKVEKVEKGEKTKTKKAEVQEPKIKETPKAVKVPEVFKPKSTLSREPVITLKPLLRKKKKSHPLAREEHSHTGFSKDRSESTLTTSPSTDTKKPFTSTGKITPEMSGTGLPSAGKAVLDRPLIDLEIRLPITVKDLSVRFQEKVSVVMKKLMSMGILVNINQLLDKDVVESLAREFGFNLAKVKSEEEQLIEVHKKEEEDPKLLKVRPPVVTFMGHVDHGKTSLLDRIRKSSVAEGEHGGITQHIGAYSVTLSKGHITFLDTPGHEAFTAMRARGVNITDIVVLVVAADEGVMPQTKEAIDHAQAANVPIVVALNKIDKNNAQPEVVKKELSEIGLMTEEWGGKTIVVGVSATTGQGVDQLLEMILLEAEILELKANPDKKASGIVVDANLSKGKGVIATLIVQSGTLKDADIVIVGPHYGKVKAMFDDMHRTIKEAGPSMPIEILGLPAVPQAGEPFYVVEDDRTARDITSKRQDNLKSEKLSEYRKVTLEDLYSQIQQGVVKELPVVIKADVQGSLEALKDSLGKIPSDKIKLKFIHTGIGDINASDVLLAAVSKAIIIAFHVGRDHRAKEEMERNPVDVREYRIIYDAVNDIKNALEGLLEAKTRKKFISRIEIRQVFKLSRSGTIAGCYVSKGKVNRKAHVDILRDSNVIFTGAISSLKRFKDDVRDVNEGMECGIAIGGFDKYQAGDIIEAFELESIAQKL